MQIITNSVPSRSAVNEMLIVLSPHVVHESLTRTNHLLVGNLKRKVSLETGINLNFNSTLEGVSGGKTCEEKSC